MSKADGVDKNKLRTIDDAIYEDINSSFGLITFNGNISIDSSVGNENSKITDDCLLLTGGFYCPNGKFGIDESAGFAGTKRVINFGSLLMDTKGLYRHGDPVAGHWGPDNSYYNRWGNPQGYYDNNTGEFISKNRFWIAAYTSYKGITAILHDDKRQSRNDFC